MDKRSSMTKMLFILLFVTLLSFLPVLSANFLNWDDDGHFLKNILVQEFTPLSIPHVFLEHNSANNTYIPLTTLSWGLEHWLFGKNPFVSHLINLLLHLGVVTVVFLLAQRFGLTLWGAFAAALIFAVHPTHVENVAWITARKDLLYGLFFLLSMYAYLDYLNCLTDSRRIKPYLTALVFGLLSILAKPMALSLPFILLLVDWMRGRRFNPMMLWDKLPFLVIIESIAWITYAQNSREMVIDFPNGFLIWFWSAAFYIQKFIWPGALSPVYSLPEPTVISNPVYWISFVVLILSGILLWRKSSNHWIVFAFVFYFLTSFFLWRFDWRDVSVVADRFLYVPCFAACLGVGRGFEWFLAKKGNIRQLAIAAFVIVSVAFAGNCFVYSFDWQDGAHLWNSVVHNSPQLASGYISRGSIYAEAGDNKLAMKDFKKAMAIASRKSVFRDGQSLLPMKEASQYASVYYHMGLMYSKEKKFKEALKYFELAVYYDIEKPEYYNNRAVALVRLGEDQKALNDYDTAITLDPKFYEPHINRGLFFYRKNRKQEALDDFLKAIKIDPTVSEAYIQAGRIYFERNDFDKALEMFQTAAKEEPENAQAFFNMGMVYLKLHDKDKAKDALTKAELKWLKDPEKYALPGMNPADAKMLAQRLGKK